MTGYTWFIKSMRAAGAISKGMLASAAGNSVFSKRPAEGLVS